VGNRRALEVHLDHLLAGVFGGLFDGGRYFIGLAITDADISTTIAGDNQCAKAERATTLDDLGATVDANDGTLDATLIGLAFGSTTAAATSALASTLTTTTATTLATSSTAATTLTPALLLL
jgi:hypothetical protein